VAVARAFRKACHDPVLGDGFGREVGAAFAQRTKPLRGMGAPIPRLRLVLSVLVVDW